jgi:hypothetical protein
MLSFCAGNAFIYQVNTQAMQIKSTKHHSIDMLCVKTLHPRGYSVPEADAMSTAPGQTNAVYGQLTHPNNFSMYRCEDRFFVGMHSAARYVFPLRA